MPSSGNSQFGKSKKPVTKSIKKFLNEKLKVKTIVNHSGFEIAMLVVIVLNSGSRYLPVIVIIGFIDQDEDRQELYDEIDYYFVIVYLLEFGMKIVALGILKYFRDNWNRLDFILIVVTLTTDFAVSLFKVLRNARTVKATRIVRINKTYRLIRILRSFRVNKSLLSVSDISRNVQSYSQNRCLMLKTLSI